jgi:hypothetical protein
MVSIWIRHFRTKSMQDRNTDTPIDTKRRQEHGQMVIILGMSENQIQLTNDLYLKIKINVLYFTKI